MITYAVGDATQPVGTGPKIIAHICNDVGGWGAGFVLAISRRWPEPEAAYRREQMPLGFCQLVPVARDLIVANMIAQRGFPTRQKPCAVDYAALRIALEWVFRQAAVRGATVHMPRIGAGIAGGDWDTITAIIASVMGTVPVTIYDLPTRATK